MQEDVYFRRIFAYLYLLRFHAARTFKIGRNELFVSLRAQKSLNPSDTGRSVCVFRPRPALMRRVENLSIEKRDDELLQEMPEAELRFKKFALFQRTAKAPAFVFLSEMSVGDQFDSFDKQRRYRPKRIKPDLRLARSKYETQRKTSSERRQSP